MYRNYPENFWGPGQDLGGLCPPGPNLEPPLMKAAAAYMTGYSFAVDCFTGLNLRSVCHVLPQNTRLK